jgi:nicotinate-nucleotide adenylyltransferase
MATRRLGLFGGSFNPVHNGHLALARRAFEQLRLDELWFIPCARSADGKALAPAAARLRWLRKALKGEPGFRVWDGELERGGVSRSIDTVRQLRAELGPQPRLYWLLGLDQALRLKSWKEPQALAREIVFGVFRRTGQNSRPLSSFRYRWIKSPLLEVSSSEIRLRIKQKKELSGLVPESIRQDKVLQTVFR